MHEDVEAQLRELGKALDDFGETLRQINNFNAENRRQGIHKCNQLEQQAKTLRSAVLLEIKAVENDNMRQQYKDQLREKHEIFKNLCAQLEMKKNEIDRELLEAGKRVAGNF